MTSPPRAADLSGKRVLVTGATSGIGRATVSACVAAGARVAATGRRAAALAEVKDQDGVALALAGDVTDAGFRVRLIAGAVTALDGLDVLVNAAGILEGGSWETTTLADWDRMLDVNLRSVLALTQLAIPHLAARRGAIVNVSSVTGTRAFPNVLAYCVSKAGLDQLTRCLALELAPQGVRVNAVNPGVVRTNLHRAGGMSEDRYAAFLEHSKTTHPLGRVGEPADVAAAIAFLASDAAAWITGETLAVDGGRNQTCAR
jgi:NAD(P)-dependent dehydrogenase (short-subunit alcohol dehydrogenase family)